MGQTVKYGSVDESLALYEMLVIVILELYFFQMSYISSKKRKKQIPKRKTLTPKKKNFFELSDGICFERISC